MNDKNINLVVTTDPILVEYYKKLIKSNIKINDLINYSLNLYEDQGFKLVNKNLQNELSNKIGLKTKILFNKDKHNGSLTIKFKNLDQLEYIMKKFN